MVTLGDADCYNYIHVILNLYYYYYYYYWADRITGSYAQENYYNMPKFVAFRNVKKLSMHGRGL